MMNQINKFLEKKPDRKTIIGLVTALVLMCLCCLCLAIYFIKPPPPAPPQKMTETWTPTETMTETETETPTITPSISVTLSPSPTPTLTPTLTLTRTPTETLTPSITPTPNPLDGPISLAVFYRTGNVWVVSRNNNSVVELDGNDLQVVSTLPVDSPNGIAIWQDKGFAYITNRNSDSVTEIDLVAHQITQKIQVGKHPFGVTVVQSTGVLFVANNASNDITCIPADRSTTYTATPTRELTLNGPTHLFGFSYNTDIPNVAIVVDSQGTVAYVSLSNSAVGLRLFFKAAPSSPCVVGLVTTIGKDGLADVAQSSYTDPQSFYVTDISGSLVELVPFPPYNGDGTPPSNPQVKLPRYPYAVANMEKCVGVVVPDQDRLYALDPASGKVLAEKKVGKQGKNGGMGLSYNPNSDTAYVTNASANSVSRITNPCQ